MHVQESKFMLASSACSVIYRSKQSEDGYTQYIVYVVLHLAPSLCLTTSVTLLYVVHMHALQVTVLTQHCSIDLDCVILQLVKDFLNGSAPAKADMSFILMR